MSTADLDFDAPDDGSGADRADATGVSDASDQTAAELGRLEAAPLHERAGAYDALADRLRAELEHSDPSRDA